MSTVIEQIKNKLDIVNEIGAVVPLRQSGKAYKGLCPFHGERTPSFYVFPQSNSWRCFGCNEGGDLIAFVQKQQALDFKEALGLLAEKAGVTLDHGPVSAESVAEASARKRLRALNEAAAIWFHAQMLQSSAAQYARAYLAARGVSNDSIAQWRLGFAPDGDELTRYLLGQGYTERELLDAGLTRQRETGGLYDYFRGRIIFPIRDGRGVTVAFGGRELGGGQPKYLNTPQTALYDKSATLFGLDMAREAIRKHDQVIIVEGYMDVIVPFQEGTRNIVAVTGSAITEKHIHAIKKLTRRVVLALDPDAAGDSAAARGITVAQKAFDRVAVPVVGPGQPSHDHRRGGIRGTVRLEEQVDADIRVARLPRGLDPDELVRQDPAAWLHALASAVPLVDFLFDAWTSDLALDTPQGKMEASKRLLPVIAEVRSRTLAGEYVDRLAMKLRLDVHDLQRELALTRQHLDREARQRLVAQRDVSHVGALTDGLGPPAIAQEGDFLHSQEHAAYTSRPDARQASPRREAPASMGSLGEMSPEGHCLGMLLEYPETWQEIGAILDPSDFASSETRALYGWLAEVFSQGSEDLGERIETLESPLAELAAAARGRVRAEEPPDTPMLLKEASQAAFRVKRGRLRAELAEVDALLREAEGERDDGAVRELLGRKQRLLSERRTLDRASPLQA